MSSLRFIANIPRKKRCLQSCRVISLTGLLLFFQLLALAGQTRRFQPFSQNDFPHGALTTLLQDQHGFLWIGSSDGLGRYDGTALMEYRHLPRDTNSLSNNYIYSLFEAQDGSIWVGTRQGISVYHPSYKHFYRIRANTSANEKEADIVINITQDRHGFIWYGTYYGLFRLDPKTNNKQRILPYDQHNDQSVSTVVWMIHEDQQGRLLVGSGSGLYVYANDESFCFDIYPNILENSLRQVWSIVEQHNGTIWLGTNDGVYRMEESPTGLQFERHFEDELSNNFVETMSCEGDSLLWVGTWKGGLHEIDLRTHQLINYQQSTTPGIGSNKITAICRDRSSLLWVGSASGLSKTTDKQQAFNIYLHQANNVQSLSNNIIKSIHKDQIGNLWVGTYKGLNFVAAEDLEEGHFRFQRFFHEADNPNSLSANNIFGLHEDSQGLLWIATDSGLNYIDTKQFSKTPIFHRITMEDGLPNYYVHEVKEIHPGEYWVGTASMMAKMYFDINDPKRLHFDSYGREKEQEGAIVNTMVYTFTQDRFDRWWMGTFDGISQHHIRDGSDFFSNYQYYAKDRESLSDNSIRCFFRDSQDRLWIGTRAGLNLVRQNRPDERAQFTSFGSESGFTNDVINFVEEDAQGQFWVGTQAGLFKFDPAQALAGENGVQRVYKTNDGLASANTIFRASFQDEDGTIYFGTAKGLHVFHPDHLPFNPVSPSLAFTQLEVLNKIVHPSDLDNDILVAPIHLATRMNLNYKQNVFRISFSAMDFTAPQENQYKYRLLGFQEDWVETQKNSATYTNLAAGNYRFQVVGSNNDGVWNLNPIELSIQVKPPFWQTNWAYFIYALSFLALVYYIIRSRVKAQTRNFAQQLAIQKARHEEREILRQKNAADFHDELGHRLTKISLFLALAEQQSAPDEKWRMYLQKIKHQAEGLSSGMRDLIWTLDPQQDNFLQTLIRLRDFGDKLFEYSEVHFQIEGIHAELENIRLKPDHRKNLLLLFKEAMHNCLKYAQASQAKLKVQNIDNRYIIELIDNGKGMDLQQANNGYGLKNMQSRASKLNAQLDIESSINQGTTVRLQYIPHMG